MNTAQLLNQSDARCNSGWTAGCGLSPNKRFVELNSFLAHAWNYSHENIPHSRRHSLAPIGTFTEKTTRH